MRRCGLAGWAPAGRSVSRWPRPWSATGCARPGAARPQPRPARAAPSAAGAGPGAGLSPARAPAPAAAELALAALDDLDREINGGLRAPSPAAGRLPARWSKPPSSAGAARPRRPAGLARAALAGRGGDGHGGRRAGRAGPRQPDRQRDRARGPASLGGGDDRCRGLRISVSNTAPGASDRGEGRAPARSSPRPRPSSGRLDRRPAHGGRFLVQRPAGAWAAILELPLADPDQRR